MKLGSELSAQSDGLFNPAIGHLIDTWGFHSNDPEGHQPPEPATLKKLLADNPQMGDLQLDGISLKSINPNVKLDFGAFGKGYGISLAMQHLQQLGIENAIINAGGDLQAIGSRNGAPWRIGIRHPSGEGVIATVETRGNESVFTSGDYERNFTWKGRRYHHIIDPRTGYPAEGTRSVTVIDSDATRADAAATALFIAGPNQWFNIAQQMGITQVLLFDEAGYIHITPDMAARVELAVDKEKIRISPAINSGIN
ncbi:MAG: FAD:protein FMN transferase [Chromatiales bacterium]|nr:FAD:protein FMN transferase [Chromatiales bacterium]